MNGQSAAPSPVLSISLLLLLVLVSVLVPSQSLAVDQAVNGWYKPVGVRDLAWGSAAVRPRLNVNPRGITTTTTSTSTAAPTTTEGKIHDDVINPRALVFPSEDDKMLNRLRVQPDDKMSQQIPLEFINKLNDAKDWTAFLDLVENVTIDKVDDETGDHDYLVGEWEDVVARTAARDPGVTVAKQASCQPEIQTIKLVQSEDPSIIYLPSCTRIERCGGCCNSELLECQPTKGGEETVMLQVTKMQYNSGKLKPSGKEIMPVQKHTKCACQCKVKETDCNKNQEYNKGACRCDCTNIDDRRKCEADNQTRFWDSGSCQCKCRLSGEANALGQCSTGFYFNEDTCKCDAYGVNRHSDINGVRAIIGEGGRRPTVNGKDDEFAVSSPARPWTHDNKKDDDYEVEDDGKESRPFTIFKFPDAASRQG